MTKYASDTRVTVATSKTEIERILQRYGADQFMHGWNAENAVIGFRMQSRFIRMVLPLPDRKDKQITHTETGKLRVQNSQNEFYEQACRQRWRALVLILKAKLEAIECGVSTLEREFLADTVMQNGMTVHEWAEPQLREMYISGEMPPLLPGVDQRSIEA